MTSLLVNKWYLLARNRYCDELHYGPGLETEFGPGFLTNLTKKPIKDDRVEILLLGQHIIKNTLQHQQFVESLAELLEPTQIPSSVMKFAVIRSLVLMRLQNCSINWGKVVALITVHFRSPSMNCLWIRVSRVKAGGFPGSKISPVVQFLVRNIDLVWRAATMPNKKLSNRHISPTVQAKRSENSVLGRL